MPEDKFPQHIELIAENTLEVSRLVQIHITLTGKKGGRRSGVEVLNKSGVVLLIACWEAFIEEASRQAFKFLLRHAKDPGVFPNKVLALAGRDLKNHKDETRIWDLASDGWKKVLRTHESDVLRRHVSPVNVPDTKRVNELFEELLGIKHLSSCWQWEGMPATRAVKKLDRIIKLRHEIAHNVKTATPVYKDMVI